MKTSTIILRASSIIAALILFQTLYFKFTGHEDSVYIFSVLGVGTTGRIGLGVVELIAGILLLIPRTTSYGGLLGLGVISGALISHLFILGIVVQDDGGTLFILALTVFICCSIVVYLKRIEISGIIDELIGKKRDS